MELREDIARAQDALQQMQQAKDEAEKRHMKVSNDPVHRAIDKCAEVSHVCYHVLFLQYVPEGIGRNGRPNTGNSGRASSKDRRSRGDLSCCNHVSTILNAADAGSTSRAFQHDPYFNH
eukprot:SAG31_NODE_6348_length_2052_cov_5.239424_2_plen_119_part_00